MTTIYTTDAMGVFAGALDVDPYAALPPRSTLTPPPSVVGEQVARLTAGAWEVLPAYPAPSSAGGAGGAAVVGNSYITWINTGTRYGAIT